MRVFDTFIMTKHGFSPIVTARFDTDFTTTSFVLPAPWFLRNDASYPEVFTPGQGPPHSPPASEAPSDIRRDRQNRTARNRAAHRRRKIRARLARERAQMEL